MKAAIYKWLPIIFGCHCRKDRSFHYKGQKFPICARCTGELAGIILSIFSCFFFRCTLLISLLLLIPMITDGFIQSLTDYESTNSKRFATGLLFGYGLFMILAVTTIIAFDFGFNLHSKINLR